MVNQPHKIDKDYKCLLTVIGFSVACYIASLFLPAIGFYHSPMNGGDEWIQYDKGYELLFIGTIFGWASALFKANIGALAVYANFVYVLVVFLLIFRVKLLPAIMSLLMILLASLSFVYRDAGGEIPSPLGDEISLWGYGAFLWFFAQAIVAIAGFMQIFREKSASIWFYILLFVIAFAYISEIQRQKYSNLANELERESYFSKWIMLTTKEMSGIEYINLSEILQVAALSSDTVVGIIDNEIEYRKYSVINPTAVLGYQESFVTPNKFQYKGHFWQVHEVCEHYSCMNIAELSEKKDVDYYYTIKSYTNNVDYLVTDKNKNVVWQAKTRAEKLGHKYFPNYGSELYQLFERLKTPSTTDEEDLRDLIVSQTYNTGVLGCRVDSYSRVSNAIKLEGRVYQMSEYDLSNFRLWCSEKYLALIETEKNNNIPKTVIFFEREPDIHPIRIYAWSYLDENSQNSTKLLSNELIFTKDLLKRM